MRNRRKICLMNEKKPVIVPTIRNITELATVRKRRANQMSLDVDDTGNTCELITTIIWWKYARRSAENNTNAVCVSRGNFVERIQ